MKVLMNRPSKLGWLGSSIYSPLFLKPKNSTPRAGKSGRSTICRSIFWKYSDSHASDWICGFWSCNADLSFSILKRAWRCSSAVGKFHFGTLIFYTRLGTSQGKIRRRWPSMWKMPPREAGLELWASAKLETFETIEWYDRLFTIARGFFQMFFLHTFFAMPTRHHNWGDERFPWLRDCQMWHLAPDRYQNAEPTTKPFGYAPNSGLAMAKRARCWKKRPNPPTRDLRWSRENCNLLHLNS